MTSRNTSRNMWLSKLGNNYPQEFMVKNEAKLLKKLHQIKDKPENRLCADCGTRGTVWTSVNLGVFLCMTCGAHHRSLGTHISKTKGCIGACEWGPDEIDQMNFVGNAKARELYGTAQPPPGITPEHTIAWKQFLVDKYVHRKFAEPLSWPPTTNEDGRDDLNRLNERRRRHSRSKKEDEKGLNRAIDQFLSLQKTVQPKPVIIQTSPRKEEMDLISFENTPASISASNSRKSMGRLNNPNTTHDWQYAPQNSKHEEITVDNKDFFAEFGL